MFVFYLELGYIWVQVSPTWLGTVGFSPSGLGPHAGFINIRKNVTQAPFIYGCPLLNIEVNEFNLQEEIQGILFM